MKTAHSLTRREMRFMHIERQGACLLRQARFIREIGAYALYAATLKRRRMSQLQQRVTDYVARKGARGHDL